MLCMSPFYRRYSYTIYASSKDSQEKAVKSGITVTAGKSVRATELNLTPIGNISGKARLDGAASGNLGIMVFIAGTSYAAMTDDTGAYTISGVPAGASYALVASSIVTKGYDSAIGSAQVTAFATTAAPDIVLLPQILVEPSPLITAFSIAHPVAAGIIDEAEREISITVPYGTDRSAMLPVFSFAGASISPALGSVQDFSKTVTYTVRAISGATRAYQVSVTVAPDRAKAITDFILTEPVAVGSIDESSHTIAIMVPFGTSLSSLTPTIAHSGVSLSPATGTVRDFSSPVAYTVTATDGSVQDYTVRVAVALNTAKAINAFSFASPAATGIISEASHSIAIAYPFGTNVQELVPTIVHSGESISPGAGTAQDFRNPVTYRVRAADGSEQAYTVTVTVALNPAKAITAFDFGSIGVIGAVDETSHRIALTVPYETDIANLVPTITHSGASISPASGIAHNFTNSATYTVTAADGMAQAYAVTVTRAAPSSNANLKSLSLSEGTLDPVFTETTLSYTVGLPNSVSSITVTGVCADTHATITYIPSRSPTVIIGTSVITIRVTAQSGHTQDYTVRILAFGDRYSTSIGTLKYVPSGTIARIGPFTRTVSAFRMSQYEITRAQFCSVTSLTDPSNSSYSSGMSDPVQNVSWYHALVFCNMLSMKEGLTPVYRIDGSTDPANWGSVPTTDDSTWSAVIADWSAAGYRLPTENEWYWAAIGGFENLNPGVFSGSDGSNFIGDYAVYGYPGLDPIYCRGGTTTERSNPVGSKLPNRLGLYDMTGNVEEWNWDWDGWGTSPYEDKIDYRGPDSGTSRSTHGCSWGANGDMYIRMSRIYSLYPSGQDYMTGFRVVRN
jgi:formylglycine-generating enzyme required for sulfatase activity